MSTKHCPDCIHNVTWRQDIFEKSSALELQVSYKIVVRTVTDDYVRETVLVIDNNLSNKNSRSKQNSIANINNNLVMDHMLPFFVYIPYYLLVSRV